MKTDIIATAVTKELVFEIANSNIKYRHVNGTANVEEVLRDLGFDIHDDASSYSNYTIDKASHVRHPTKTNLLYVTDVYHGVLVERKNVATQDLETWRALRALYLDNNILHSSNVDELVIKNKLELIDATTIGESFYASLDNEDKEFQRSIYSKISGL